MAAARVVQAAAMGLVSTPSESDSEITPLDLLDEDGLPVLPDIDDMERIASLDDDVDSEDLDRLEEQAEGEMLETMGAGPSDEEEPQGERGPESDESSEEEDRSDEPAGPDAPGPASGSSGGSRSPSPEVYGFLEPEYVATVVSDLREHGMIECLRRHAIARPSNILPLLLSLGVMLPQSMMVEGQAEPMSLLPLLKVVLTRILRQRRKIPQYNTVDDVLELLRNSKRTVVLSGAGISVSCGIPDFRSKDGIYAILRDDQNYQLDDPSDMFDKDFFMQDPSMFFSFAHSIYPANFEPSPSHHFVKQLETHGKLLRMYSQNIDTLEQKAGIERVLQCHGSFATATCTDPACRLRVDGRAIRDYIMAKQVPPCPRCAERRAQEAPRPTKRQKLDTWGGDSSEEEERDLAYGVLKVSVAGLKHG